MRTPSCLFRSWAASLAWWGWAAGLPVLERKMVPRYPKHARDMTRGELLTSLVAFTAICGLIDAVNIVALVRHGFSSFGMAGVAFTTILLVAAWFDFGGEFRRRRRDGKA